MKTDLKERIDFYYTNAGRKELRKEKQVLTIKVLELILNEAISNNASDVHMEPMENVLLIRFRVDGILHHVLSIDDIEVRDGLINSIKAHASMHSDGSAKRKPQDGRWGTQFGDEMVDFRLSTFPVVNGEKLVMRILRQNTALFSLDAIGMSEEAQRDFSAFLEKKSGVVCVTGPTGSGKSTTLYAALNHLNQSDKNILTLEDPVEFKIKGINQSCIDPSCGFDFADGLRAALRQDPDIVFVGEVRDSITAEICMRASMTGHLLLTTLHTNDAPTAFTRLIDMGIEPFLIAASPTMVINQRLVRTLCDECKAPVQIETSEIPESLKGLTENNVTFYEARGCDSCGGTGFKGRRPVFEYMMTNDELKKMIVKRASSSEIRKCAMQNGMYPIEKDIFRLLQEGVTTLAEVIQIMNAD